MARTWGLPRGRTAAQALTFCCCSNGLFALGVADGVYMWAKLGIDSGVFSRGLMDTAKRAVEAGTADVLNGAKSETCVEF